jgi:hypothetical protein
MKGHRYVIKRIDLLRIIVVFQIHEECLLVRQIPVTGEMVMNLEMAGTVLKVFLFITA